MVVGANIKNIGSSGPTKTVQADGGVVLKTEDGAPGKKTLGPSNYNVIRSKGFVEAGGTEL